MKKKIAMILAAVLSVGMLSACGDTTVKVKDGNGSEVASADVKQDNVDTENDDESGTITISELINERIKEDGEFKFYYIHYAAIGKDVGVTKDSSVEIYSYDGKVMKKYTNPNTDLGKTRIGNIAQEKVDFSTYEIKEIGAAYEKENGERYEDEKHYAGLEIVSDDSGNNAKLESLYNYQKGILYERNDDEEDPLVAYDKEYYGNFFVFGMFNRVQIYDKTYMTFHGGENNANHSSFYIIVPDTKSTENKTVEYDKVGTDGITVDTIGDLKKYYAID